MYVVRIYVKLQFSLYDKNNSYGNHNCPFHAHICIAHLGCKLKLEAQEIVSKDQACAFSLNQEFLRNQKRTTLYCYCTEALLILLVQHGRKGISYHNSLRQNSLLRDDLVKEYLVALLLHLLGRNHVGSRRRQRPQPLRQVDASLEEKR